VLLAGAADHARECITGLSGLPLGPEVLVQLDRLVALLETPAYAFLRLQLLQPGRYPDLIRALYGLLMLLPQSSAFKTLQARLSAVPLVGLMQLEEAAAGGGSSSKRSGSSSSGGAVGPSTWAPFPDLLQQFLARQAAHAAEEERKRALLEGLLVEEDIAAEQAAQASAAAAEAAAAAAVAAGTGGGGSNGAAATAASAASTAQ
jgi:vacuole morphology and inheritance protein 14